MFYTWSYCFVHFAFSTLEVFIKQHLKDDEKRLWQTKFMTMADQDKPVRFRRSVIVTSPADTVKKGTNI